MAKKPKKVKIPKQEATAQRLATEQQKLNQAAGQINEQGPFGSQTYTTGADGRTTRTTALSPEEQSKLSQSNALDASINNVTQGLAGQAAQTYGTPFQGTTQDMLAKRQAVEDQTFKAYESRLNPYWERQRQSQEASLANRGIAPGSRGYAAAMGDTNTQMQDAYLQAQNAANTAGRGEADTLFNQDVTRYQMPAQMIGQMRQNVSGVNTPQGVAPNTQAPDYMGGAVSLYNQANQKAIAGMASSGGGSESTPMGAVTGSSALGAITIPGSTKKLNTSKQSGLVGLGRLASGGY
jgi:hypothetical protein